MTMQKHEIPILEYDDNPSAVLNPNHEKLSMDLPERAVFGFLYDHVDDFARKNGFSQVGTFISATKSYPVWVGPYEGKQVCLMQAPVGAAPAAQILDWLMGYGVRKVIAAGSCGVLVPMAENTFLVPEKALRDEGTSYHYAPPSRYMVLEEQAIRAIEATFAAHNRPCRRVTTWSTDGFFRETEEKVAYRKAEGCQVVEMECSALAAVAAFRGGIVGQILFTADTLADPDGYDERDWGGDSFAPALAYSLEAVCRL